MATLRKMHERRGWGFWFAVSLVKPVLLALTRRDWRNVERIPYDGGVIVALNHLSHLDPLTSAHLVYDSGRLPHYLAKAGLWSNGFLSRVLDATHQIPVERESRGADAFSSAVEAVTDGALVVVYPEATITRDPGLWPMRGKSGAARIALQTGAPVVPIGQWGAQDILAPYAKKPHLFPRKVIHMSVGEPVDLDDLRGRPLTPEVVAEATERIMAGITRELEGIRGEKAPAHRWDMKVDGDRFKKDTA